MEIILASNAGFCFGVRAAINKGEKLIEEGKDINIDELRESIHKNANEALNESREVVGENQAENQKN